MAEGILFGVVVGVGWLNVEAAASKKAAKGVFASGSALGASNISIAINHNINGIDVGLIHGGKIGVVHEDDFRSARILFEIFLDGLFGLTDIDGKNNEAFGGKIVVDLVHEGGFISAIFAPGGPELEQDDFALDGSVGERFAVGGARGEAGRRLRARRREDRKRSEYYGTEQQRPPDRRVCEDCKSGAHDG